MSGADDRGKDASKARAAAIASTLGMAATVAKKSGPAVVATTGISLAGEWNTASAGSFKRLQVFEDALKDEIGVELLGVDASRKVVPDVQEEVRGGRLSERDGAVAGLHKNYAEHVAHLAAKRA